MGRLSKRTIQCRQARKARDLLKQQQTALKQQGRVPCSPSIELLKNLGLSSLQRYQQAYGLDVDIDRSSREELIWAIAHHFSASEVRAALAPARVFETVHALVQTRSSPSSRVGSHSGLKLCSPQTAATRLAVHLSRPPLPCHVPLQLPLTCLPTPLVWENARRS